MIRLHRQYKPRKLQDLSNAYKRADVIGAHVGEARIRIRATSDRAAPLQKLIRQNIYLRSSSFRWSREWNAAVETLDEFSNNFAAATTTAIAAHRTAPRRRRASALRWGLVS